MMEKFEDDKLPSDIIYEKLAKAFEENLNQNKDMLQSEEVKQKAKFLVEKLSENEVYLDYLNSFLVKNARYKIVALQVGLEDAIATTRRHKNEILALNLFPQAEIPPQKKGNYTVKTALYQCCTNQGSILNTLLWFMLFQNLFTQPKTTAQMAYEQTEILQNLYRLF